jgi:hypothetical protein
LDFRRHVVWLFFVHVNPEAFSAMSESDAAAPAFGSCMASGLQPACQRRLRSRARANEAWKMHRPQAMLAAKLREDWTVSRR